MRPSDLQVKVDGVWLRSLGHVNPPTFSSRYGDGPCGSDLATVEVELADANDTGFLRMGRDLKLYDRGVLVWGGVISGVGRGFPRTIEAKGYARRDWDATLNPEPGARIGRNPDGSSFTPTAPTSARWLLDASDLDIGVADDRLYTRVVATYVTALAPEEGGEDETGEAIANDTIAQGLYGVLPFALDLTPLGLIDGTTAMGYAQAQLREFAIPEWSSRVVTTSSRLLTRNGHPAHLPDVRAGDMVHVFHLPASFGGLRRPAATDVVLGEVEFNAAEPDQITIAPSRVAVRSIADAVREAAEARRALERAA